MGQFEKLCYVNETCMIPLQTAGEHANWKFRKKRDVLYMGCAGD